MFQNNLFFFSALSRVLQIVTTEERLGSAKSVLLLTDG
jgi:hypothetical protein